MDLRDDVDDHPTDEHELPLDDEDECLQTVDGGQHDDGDDWQRGLVQSDNDDQVDQLERMLATGWSKRRTANSRIRQSRAKSVGQ